MTPPSRRSLVIVPAPADPARWPKPHHNTEVPQTATFVGIAHYVPGNASLTAVGWRSQLASDGLRSPGGPESTADFEEPDGIEDRWRFAYSSSLLDRRIGYGLYGVRANGYWAIICNTKRQVDALLAHGADARAADALAWPVLAVGLDLAAVQRRWPALTLLRKAPSTRVTTSSPLFTPTALVHRLVDIGFAPITPLTANLTLISRQSMTFDGVPWFAFTHDRQSGSLVVSEVSTAGVARRLGCYPAVHDAIVERCWGTSGGTVAQGRQRGVVYPSSIDRTASTSTKLREECLRLGSALDGRRVSAPELEEILGGYTTSLRHHRTPPGVAASLASVANAVDGALLGQVESGSRLLLKPPNGPATRAPRLAGRAVTTSAARDRTSS